MKRKVTRKVMLPTRLDPSLIFRLKNKSAAINASISDTISLAMDALEREQKADETFSERAGSLEKNLTVLIDSITLFNQKMDQLFAQASFNEKERLKSLLKLLGEKITEKIDQHDEAERARFERFDPVAL